MPTRMKQTIAETFLRLTQKKSVDSITVKDIVDACGISRQSFYYHFQDIMEVIEWSIDQAAQRMLECSLQASTLQAALRLFVVQFIEESDTLLRFLHSQRREAVEKLLVRALSDYLHRYAQRLDAPLPAPFSHIFYAYGVIGFLSDALSSGIRDADVLSGHLYRLLTTPLFPGMEN